MLSGNNTNHHTIESWLAQESRIIEIRNMNITIEKANTLQFGNSIPSDHMDIIRALYNKKIKGKGGNALMRLIKSHVETYVDPKLIERGFNDQAIPEVRQRTLVEQAPPPTHIPEPASTLPPPPLSTGANAVETFWSIVGNRLVGEFSSIYYSTISGRRADDRHGRLRVKVYYTDGPHPDCSEAMRELGDVEYVDGETFFVTQRAVEETADGYDQQNHGTSNRSIAFWNNVRTMRGHLNNPEYDGIQNRRLEITCNETYVAQVVTRASIRGRQQVTVTWDWGTHTTQERLEHIEEFNEYGSVGVSYTDNDGDGITYTITEWEQ